MVPVPALALGGPPMGAQIGLVRHPGMEPPIPAMLTEVIYGQLSAALKQAHDEEVRVFRVWSAKRKAWATAQEEVHPTLAHAAPPARFVARTGKFVVTMMKHSEFIKQGKEHAAFKAFLSDSVAELVVPDGVYLDDSRLTVLVSQGLTGTGPPQLSALRELRDMDLFKNNKELTVLLKVGAWDALDRMGSGMSLNDGLMTGESLGSVYTLGQIVRRVGKLFGMFNPVLAGALDDIAEIIQAGMLVTSVSYIRYLVEDMFAAITLVADADYSRAGEPDNIDSDAKLRAKVAVVVNGYKRKYAYIEQLQFHEPNGIESRISMPAKRKVGGKSNTDEHAELVEDVGPKKAPKLDKKPKQFCDLFALSTLGNHFPKCGHGKSCHFSHVEGWTKAELRQRLTAKQLGAVFTAKVQREALDILK